MSCFNVDLPNAGSQSDEGDIDGMGQVKKLRECSVKVSDETTPNRQARRFRARLMEDLEEGWSIYEVWMRGKLRQT